MSSSTPISVEVTVPATTANLGPGFDCVGAALAHYNRFRFSLRSTEAIGWFEITVSGVDAERVPTSAKNLAYRAFSALYQQQQQPIPPIQISIELDVPLARGLGSSATAIVGGLLGANALIEQPISMAKLMQVAIALEGHPDNVVPALLGGCQLTVSEPEAAPVVCEIPWAESIVPVVAIPNFELSTAEARRVLPTTYSRADAIFNMAHIGLLVRGLETGHPDWLRTALGDRIHQPYRQTLIAGYDIVRAAALSAGAYGVVISGAGPTLLALAHRDQAVAVESAMSEAWSHQSISAQVVSLQIDTQGATSQLFPPEAI